MDRSLSNKTSNSHGKTNCLLIYLLMHIVLTVTALLSLNKADVTVDSSILSVFPYKNESPKFFL